VSQSAIRRCVFTTVLLLVAFSVGFVAGVFVWKRHGLPRLVPLPRPVAARRPGVPAGAPPGRWREVGQGTASRELTDRQRREMEDLAALGYLSGSRPGGAASGVTVHDTARVFGGLNFATSGHRPGAFLMDMDGRVLHEWTCGFDKAWPGRRMPRGAESHDFWRRAYLFENGDVLGIYEGLGLIKLDKESNVLWSYDGLCHHDLFVTDDGLIYVLEREPKIIPEIHSDRPVAEDFITILSADGRVLRRVSLLRAFAESEYRALLAKMPEAGDVFHTNTLELLQGRLAGVSSAFRAGNVLVSVLWLDTVAVVDMETESVVWALTGLWRQQHQPTILDDGRMLVFDNEAGKGVSRVLEIDPFTQQIFWEYRGGPGRPFYTSTCGSCQRLPNGNTLITESDNGRAFEVTRDGEIVWEFINPHRAGENGELIATLFEVVRLPRDFPLDWMPVEGP